MNHNFLPYDICEMLPKENPYNIGITDKIYWIKPYPESSFDKLTIKTHSVSSINQSCINRDAWTILDALTWLEEQGYFIEVISSNPQYKTWDCLIRNTILNLDIDTLNIEYNSRTEAYTEGIRHCLNLMKDETK